MKIALAYLCGEYPRATDTFIQREIRALRLLGVQIETISVRRPSLQEQGGDEQELERQKTHYLLPCTPWSLLTNHLALCLKSPKRYCCALRMALFIRAPGVRALLYQLYYFAEAGMVAAHMQQQGLTHLHNHAPDSSGYVAILASELTGITYSMTIHGFGILSEPNRWRLREKIEKSLFTICVSHHARSQAMLWSRRPFWSRLHVVHCGINAESIPIRHHTDPANRILFVGRFDHVKGLPLLLKAFATLSERHQKLHLDLVGDGPERHDLELIAEELNLNDRITFHGYHSQEELRIDYARADIFALTSFMEGIPVVLMEAMAHGVPVVAPRITGIPELIETGISGLLYSPGVLNQLIKNIELLLNDAELRNRLAKAGQQTVMQEFNISIESQHFYSILRANIPQS